MRSQAWGGQLRSAPGDRQLQHGHWTGLAMQRELEALREQILHHHAKPGDRRVAFDYRTKIVALRIESVPDRGFPAGIRRGNLIRLHVPCPLHTVAQRGIAQSDALRRDIDAGSLASFEARIAKRGGFDRRGIE